MTLESVIFTNAMNLSIYTQIIIRYISRLITHLEFLVLAAHIFNKEDAMKQIIPNASLAQFTIHKVTRIRWIIDKIIRYMHANFIQVEKRS